MILSRDLDPCPEPVARYLNKAGVVGNSRKTFAHILHGGEFRLKPKQKWLPIQGEYLFNPEVPSFEWRASIKIFPFITIAVLDEYKNGTGRSLVKLASIFKIADQTGPEISESSLGRLLIELLMIPTALVPSERLRWEAIDSSRARAILNHNQVEVAATFEFDAEGLPVKTSIDRFGNFDGKMKKNSFVCDFVDYRVHEGLLIPTDIKGCWNIAPEPFYWFHFKIGAVHFE